MQAAVGMSTELVAEAAAQGAARQAMERLGAVQSTLAFVFASYHYREKYASLVSIVRAVTGADRLVGCSASGVLAPEGEFEGVPAVVVLALRDPGSEPATFLAAAPVADPHGGAVHAHLPRGDHGPLILFPDVFEEPATETVRAVEAEVGGLPIVGGAATGDPAGMACWKFCDGEIATGALAGALVPHAGPVLVGVTTACRPVARPWTVTKAEGNVIQEIAGKPAAGVLGRVLAELPPTSHAAATGLLLGIAVNPGKFPLGRGDFLIRHVVRVDADSGAIAVSERVSVGQTVQFHVLDREAAQADMLLMLTRLKVRLANVRPKFGLYVNCVGRGQGFFGTLHHDVGLIRETLGDFPLAGFFSNAELAPLETMNCVHQYTGVLTVFA